MASIIIPPEWRKVASSATHIDAYRNRRSFLRKVGAGSIGLAAYPSLLSACSTPDSDTGSGLSGPLDTIPADAPRVGLPADRNPIYTVPERPVTDRVSAASYNNFYEFSGSSKEIWQLTGDYDPFPWTLKVEGLVEKEFRIDVEELLREFGLEERLYRFRCVEAWSMTLPWTGFPLRKLIERCKPLSTATHVAFFTALRKDEMPGIKSQPWYSWPYYEGLRLDEATHELAFVATGVFGEPLPKQHGSPLRLVIPWKYGYKGPKAVNRIRFMDDQPKTFWNDLQPAEYSFLSNVNPEVAHPRWSQASERFIESIDNVSRVPTQLLNGYAEFVGDLYPDEPR
jgi:sulfoxide reductase catalytic subunit YedY